MVKKFVLAVYGIRSSKMMGKHRKKTKVLGLCMGSLITIIGPLGLSAADAASMISRSHKEVETVMTSLFSGSRIVLDNYSDHRKNDSWLKTNGAFLTLSSALGHQTFRWTVPEFVCQTKMRKRPFYIVDLRSQNVSVDVVGNQMFLVVKFESAGTELEGKCLAKRWRGGWRNCPIGSDKGTPDGQINNLVARVALRPIPHKSGISYARIQPRDVEIAAQISRGGICKVRIDQVLSTVTKAVGAAFDPSGVTAEVGKYAKYIPKAETGLCQTFFNYNVAIKMQLAQAFMSGLNQNHVRDKVAMVTRRLLAQNQEVQHISSFSNSWRLSVK